MLSFTKLSTKILFAIFAGMAITLLALSFLAFTFTKTVLEQSIMENQLEIARQTMDKIDRLLNERVLNIQTIAGAPPIQNALIPGNLDTGDFKKIASKRIGEFTEVTGPWDLLMMVDKEGKIVISSDEKLLGQPVSGQQQNYRAYQTVMKEDFYYSDFVISENTGQLSMIFAAPISNPNTVNGF